MKANYANENLKKILIIQKYVGKHIRTLAWYAKYYVFPNSQRFVLLKVTCGMKKVPIPSKISTST